MVLLVPHIFIAPIIKLSLLKTENPLIEYLKKGICMTVLSITVFKDMFCVY